MKGERITTTKDGVESFNNEIDNYLTPTQMVFQYVKSSGHPSQIEKAQLLCGDNRIINRGIMLGKGDRTINIQAS